MAEVAAVETETRESRGDLRRFTSLSDIYGNLPLGQNEIRVLRFQPAENMFDPIRINL
jgi:hypothetical protein